MADRAPGTRPAKAHFNPLSALGPGLITGAADDDPSGIATYSQAGAQFGFQMLWTMWLTYPLQGVFQSLCARIGRVTGQGLAANIKQVFPRWVLLIVVALVLIANTLNVSSDVAAMGEAASLLLPGHRHLLTLAFAAVTLGLLIFIPYHRYVLILKWLTISLFAYVAVAFIVRAPWAEVALRTFLPQFRLGKDSITIIVAIFGTTISPYLFFWQASEEVEEIENHPGEHPLRDAPLEAKEALTRIGWDTYVGMFYSNLIAYFVILATAVTLNAKGVTNIQTASQAAEALRPIAGDLASALFAVGIIGTGFLAIPTLAGSAAYALSEAMGWREGLELKFNEARGFYLVIALSVLGGVALGYSPLDPIKALFLSAVVNGVVAVPLMAIIMLLVGRRDLMGRFVAARWQRIGGWTATALMAAAAAAMFATM
ncbi:MAG TPA: divalent metal cation transporter [Caulobacteraceae bacterium]|nr:divalent metal cation transporter [Caulobacteraceae bacterium]